MKDILLFQQKGRYFKVLSICAWIAITGIATIITVTTILIYNHV